MKNSFVSTHTCRVLNSLYHDSQGMSNVNLRTYYRIFFDKIVQQNRSLSKSQCLQVTSRSGKYMHRLSFGNGRGWLVSLQIGFKRIDSPIIGRSILNFLFKRFAKIADIVKSGSLADFINIQGGIP